MFSAVREAPAYSGGLLRYSSSSEHEENVSGNLHTLSAQIQRNIQQFLLTEGSCLTSIFLNVHSNRAHSDVHNAAPKDQTVLHTSQMSVCLGFKPTPCFVNSEKTLEKLVETSVKVRTVVQWPSVITTLHGMDSSDDYPADMKQAVNLPLIAALPSLPISLPPSLFFSYFLSQPSHHLWSLWIACRI